MLLSELLGHLQEMLKNNHDVPVHVGLYDPQLVNEINMTFSKKSGLSRITIVHIPEEKES